LGLNAAEAWRCIWKDHAAHQSPNAGWPEAAAAGALGIRLGGPNYYGGVLVDKPWINRPGRDATAGDADHSLRLMQLATLLAVAATFLGAWGLGWWG
jgi:adenosylcobinamide-phosphate synthase